MSTVFTRDEALILLSKSLKFTSGTEVDYACIWYDAITGEEIASGTYNKNKNQAVVKFANGTNFERARDLLACEFIPEKPDEPKPHIDIDYKPKAALIEEKKLQRHQPKQQAKKPHKQKDRTSFATLADLLKARGIDLMGNDNE